MTVYISGTTGYSGPVGVLGDLTTTGNTILGDQSTDTLNVANGNLTLNSSGLMTVPAGGVIQGMTVGRGAGAVATNTAVGDSALAANTSGAGVSAVGSFALYNNTTGSYNTAIGSRVSGATQGALQNNTTGSSNTAIGNSALSSNTTASNNTAVGYQAATSNTTGTSIDAFGRFALYGNTTGNYNSGVGSSTLQNNTTGSNNVAVGYQSLLSNTTAGNNTAIGFQAGYSNTTGKQNTFVGYLSGYTFNNTSGGDTYNAFFGMYSGYGTTTGVNNTFLGAGAGQSITTGSKNTIVGQYSGNSGGLDIRTANNNIVLSDGDGNPRAYHNGYNWFSTSGGFISKLGSAYSNSYTTDSAWATTWATIIPGGTLGRGVVYLIYLQWNYSSGGSPYYLDTTMIFTGQSTNGTGPSNEIALLSSTHTGNANVYYVVRSVATPGSTAGVQIKMIDNTTPGNLYVNVTIIGA